MNLSSQKTTAGVASLLTAAVVLGILPSSLTTTGLAYAQEEFNVDVAIDSVSFDKKAQEVTVDFTVTCSQFAEFSDAFVSVRQTAGEQGHFGGKTVSGFEFIGYDCNGATPLSVTIEPERGFFTPGKALVFVEVTACATVLDEVVCKTPTTEEQVRLSNG
jgi:hypothetical protein